MPFEFPIEYLGFVLFGMVAGWDSCRDSDVEGHHAAAAARTCLSYIWQS